jgi:hypothetical protein
VDMCSTANGLATCDDRRYRRSLSTKAAPSTFSALLSLPSWSLYQPDYPGGIAKNTFLTVLKDAWMFPDAVDTVVRMLLKLVRNLDVGSCHKDHHHHLCTPQSLTTLLSSAHRDSDGRIPRTYTLCTSPFTVPIVAEWYTFHHKGPEKLHQGVSQCPATTSKAILAATSIPPAASKARQMLSVAWRAWSKASCRRGDVPDTEQTWTRFERSTFQRLVPAGWRRTRVCANVIALASPPWSSMSLAL